MSLRAYVDQAGLWACLECGLGEEEIVSIVLIDLKRLPTVGSTVPRQEDWVCISVERKMRTCKHTVVNFSLLLMAVSTSCHLT